MTWRNDATRANDVTTTGPTDVAVLLERLVPLVERLQGQRATTAGAPGPQQPEQLRKALDLIKTILVPGADGKSLPLGQVNGALGQTIGNLLNGKKTAIGLLGAVATPLLTQASTTTALGSHSRHADAGGRAAPFTLPVFLGLTAWGVLGKMEKWAQGTAPPPGSPSVMPKSGRRFRIRSCDRTRSGVHPRAVCRTRVEGRRASTVCKSQLYERVHTRMFSLRPITERRASRLGFRVQARASGSPGRGRDRTDQGRASTCRGFPL